MQTEQIKAKRRRDSRDRRDVRCRGSAPARPRRCCGTPQPAQKWDEALPVGNGRLGAMVFGGPGSERMQLNEQTIWTGGPYDPTRPGGPEALPEIRRLVFAGKYFEAEELFGKTMLGKPVEQMKYQPLGNLLHRVSRPRRRDRLPPGT